VTAADGTYSVVVRREFLAWHYLIGGDFGPENERNSHQYGIEVRYDGPELDEHGFLVDIDEVQRGLDGVVSRYRDQTLNDFPEFAGLNPSVEHFARILCDTLAIDRPNLSAIEVTVWEDDAAGAGHRRRRGRRGRSADSTIPPRSNPRPNRSPTQSPAAKAVAAHAGMSPRGTKVHPPSERRWRPAVRTMA
jgi:6-pyruvoyltetrahydropterin/6-carboxytetrahydropterin synthase